MKMRHAKIVTALVLVSAVFVSGCVDQIPPIDEQAMLKRFSSRAELEAFLEANAEAYFGAEMLGGTFSARTDVAESAAMPTGAPDMQTGAGEAAGEYSTTNIQVEGVDEADIVKNDGRYIYTVAGDKVVIVDAFPAESAHIVAEIDTNSMVSEIFINGNKLVVMGIGYLQETVDESEAGEAEIGIAPSYPSYYTPFGTFINVYDITDKSNPVIERNLTVSGHYYDSRMIGDHVYIISNENIYYRSPGPVPLPVMIQNDVRTTIPAREIYYFDVPDYSYTYTNIIVLNTQSADEDVNRKTFLMGYSSSMYASIDNIYMVYTKHLSMQNFYGRIVEDAIMPLLPVQERAEVKRIWNSDLEEYEKIQEIGEIYTNYVDSLDPEKAATWMKNMEQRYQVVMIQVMKEIEKTIIHKIAVDGRNIEYKTAGEVPGHVLNQFSMDEHNGYFRIATTTGGWRGESANHMYVLDSQLKITGKVEDLAPGERIYSTRFIGDKGYMVTFRQIDPLYVIDLSNPTNPQVLGYLKIPGVSDYLHPYDETHLIGVGRDATEQGIMKGMKLSLFDVSDFENPREVSTYFIGERGTSSEAIYDHKAFLFDREKDLLVIPVSLSEEQYVQSWEGAYVFGINTADGFTLKGRITHQNKTNITDAGHGWKYWSNYDHNLRIRRSLYMDDVLYTVSNGMIKANDLNDIDNEINRVELPTETYDYSLNPIGIRGGGGLIGPTVEPGVLVATEAVEIDE
jgi:inhibitor of cysteine peptidase